MLFAVLVVDIVLSVLCLDRFEDCLSSMSSTTVCCKLQSSLRECVITCVVSRSLVSVSVLSRDLRVQCKQSCQPGVRSYATDPNNQQLLTAEAAHSISALCVSTDVCA